MHQLINSLTDGSFTLDRMMQAIQSLIISTKTEDRTKSYQFIESLIIVSSNITSSISPAQLEVLTAFISSRLATEPCSMQPLLLKILHFISKHPSLSGPSAVTIFKALQTNVAFQSQPVSDRFLLYQLVGQLIVRHLDALNETLRYDFVLGFIQMIEGERDPRCLLVTFHLFKVVCSNSSVNLGSLTEDAAEVISVYFPIAYNDPSANRLSSKNPNITRDELASALNEALASNSSFAPYILPVICEKLPLDREAAKIDSYNAICLVSTVYGASAMKPYMGLVWSCARTDLLKTTPREDKVAESACKALSSLIEALEFDQETLELFLDEVLHDLSPAISKADLYLRKSAIQLVLAVTNTSNSFAFLAPKVIMKAIESLAFVRTVQNESEILQLVKRLIDSSHRQLTTIDKQIPCQTLVVSLGTDIEEAKGMEMKCQKLELLLSLLNSPLVLSDEDYDSINSLVFERLQKDCEPSLVALYGKIIASLSTKEALNIGEKVVKLVCGKKFSLDVLVNLLEHAKFPPSLQHALISALMGRLCPKTLSIIEKSAVNIATCNHALVLDTLWSLVRLFVHAKLCTSNDDIFANVTFLPVVTSITSLLTPDDAAVLLSRIAEVAFTPDILIDMVPNELISCECKNNKLPEKTAIQIISTLTLYVMRGINGDVIDAKVWTDLLTKWNLYSNEYAIDVNLLSDLVFVFANKGNEQIVESLILKCPSVISSQSFEYTAKLCHGLILRCHRESSKLVKMFNDLLITGDDEIYSKLPNLYEQLHHEPSTKLYKNMNINPLYHQRLFVLTCIDRSNLSEERAICIKKCILRQLPYLPTTVIKDDICKIGPLLISALTSKGSCESRETAVNCLLPLLENSSCKVTIAANLSSILDSLTDLCVNSDKASVRSNSLNCLTKIITCIKESELLPHRKNVLKCIKPSLEDKKRIVRYSAYVSYFAWTLLGQPGNSAIVVTEMD